MKSYLPAGCLLLVLSPTFSWAADPIALPLSGDMPPVVSLPTAVAESPEARSPSRLRDVLRQPFDDFKDDNKPYRLSVQERQRLREQLSSKSPYDFPKK